MTSMTHQAIATNFDLPSLHILLEEIEVALKDAETHLSEFHDDEDQVELLMDSATIIDQLASIFRLINFKGASELAVAIADGLKKLHEFADNSEAELIMDISEGIIVLDRYVEFVLLKEVLEPALLVSIINKLHAHLDKPAISLENLIHGNSISIANPKSHYQPLSAIGIDVKALIVAYRAGLGVVLGGGSNPTQEDNNKLKAMASACIAIADHSDTLFWQAAAIVTKNIIQDLPISNDKKRILIYVEQQLQQYLPLEDRRFADLVSLACKKNPSFIAHARDKYNLGKFNSTDIDQMKRFLFGPNREITNILNSLIQNEIDTIKEQIDGMVRDNNNINAVGMPDTILKITSLAQTMRLLGLDNASDSLKQVANEISQWQSPSPEDFDRLLNELMVAENASISLAKTHTPGAINLPLHNHNISLHQLDIAYEILIKESRTNIVNISTAIDDYMSDKDVMHLQNTPKMLEQVTGAANFLSMKQTATMLDRLMRFLIDKTITNKQQLADDLLAGIADVIAAADYQFEGQEHNRPVSKIALVVGQHSLNRVLAA